MSSGEADLNDLLGVDGPDELFAGREEAEAAFKESDKRAADLLEDYGDAIIQHFQILTDLLRPALLEHDEVPTEAKQRILQDMAMDPIIMQIAFSLAVQYLREREDETNCKEGDDG